MLKNSIIIKRRLFKVAVCSAMLFAVPSVPMMNSNVINVQAAGYPESDISDFTITNGEITSYKGSDEVVVIPEGVKSIRYQAFSGNLRNANKVIKKIVLPSSIEKIGQLAFEYLPNLEEVVFSGNITTISHNLFKNSENVKVVFDCPFTGEYGSNYMFTYVKTIEFGENFSGDIYSLINGSNAPDLQKVIISENNKEYFEENGGVYSKDGKTFITYIPTADNATFVMKEGVTTLGKYSIEPRKYKDKITIVFPESLIDAPKYTIKNKTHFDVYSGAEYDNYNPLHLDIRKCKNLEDIGFYEYMPYGTTLNLYVNSADDTFMKLDMSEFPVEWLDYNLGDSGSIKLINGDVNVLADYGMVDILLKGKNEDGSYTSLKPSGVLVDEYGKEITDAVYRHPAYSKTLRLYLPKSLRLENRSIYFVPDYDRVYDSKPVEIVLDENACAPLKEYELKRNGKITYNVTNKDEKSESYVWVLDKNGKMIDGGKSSDFDACPVEDGEYTVVFADLSGIVVPETLSYGTDNCFAFLNEKCKLTEGVDYLSIDVDVLGEDVDLGEITIPDRKAPVKYFDSAEVSFGSKINYIYNNDSYYMYPTTFSYERSVYDMGSENNAYTKFGLKFSEGSKVKNIKHSSTKGEVRTESSNDFDLVILDYVNTKNTAGVSDAISFDFLVDKQAKTYLDIYGISTDGTYEYLCSKKIGTDIITMMAPSNVTNNGFSIRGNGVPNLDVIIEKKEASTGKVIDTLVVKANKYGYFDTTDSITNDTAVFSKFTYTATQKNEAGKVVAQSEEIAVTYYKDIPLFENGSISTLGRSHKVDRDGYSENVPYDPSHIVTFDFALSNDEKVSELWLECGTKEIPFSRVSENSNKWVGQSIYNNLKSNMRLIAKTVDDGNAYVVANIKCNWIIDPSGQIYEAVKDNYVEGATASIYYKDNNGQEVLWDAESCFQVNPVITDDLGNYAWDVPEGIWKVKVTKDGYLPVESQWMTVPPVRLHVDLELKSIYEAEVTGVEVSDSDVVVRFDKYVKVDKILSDKLVLRGTDGQIALGQAVACVDAGNGLAKEIKFTASDVSLKANQPKSGYIVEIKEGFSTTYADVKSEKTYAFTGVKVDGIINDIKTDNAFVAKNGEYFCYEVKLDATDSLEGKKITATVEDDKIAEVVGVTYVDDKNTAIVAVKGNSLGATKITVGVEGSSIAKTVDAIVANDSVVDDVCDTYGFESTVKAVKKDELPEFAPAKDSEDKEESKEEDKTSDTDKNPVDDNKPSNTVTTETNTDSSSETSAKPAPKKGKTYAVKNLKYKVTSAKTNGKGTVTFVGAKKKTVTSVTIPSTVKINGYTYKVTAIGDKAFKGYKKIKTVTVGANVTKIGKNAFYGDKKLKTIKIKSAKLKTVGKNAFKGVNSKCKIKVPSKKLSAYKKILKKKGQGKGVKITK